MSTGILAVGALLAVVVAYAAVQFLTRYIRLRGQRVITCPESGEPAGVELAAGRAAVTAIAGESSLRLRDCSRWPERAGCGQECLSQIEAAPEDCLVRSILTKWYEGKSCVFCGKEFGRLDWAKHRPGLLGPDQKTVEWRDVAPEVVPGALETHKPVCWDCHIAETFRREHPGLVTDRNWKRV